MSELAALFTSIAALVSAAGGIFIGYVALTRGSPREREKAAKDAINRLTGNDEEHDEDGEQWAAIEDLRRKLGGDA